MDALCQTMRRDVRRCAEIVLRKKFNFDMSTISLSDSICQVPPRVLDWKQMPGFDHFRCYRDLMTGVQGRYDTIIILVMSLLLSAWLIGPQVLHAAWGVIDDHDTLTMIGAGNRHLPLSQYFEVMLTKTELGAIGHYVRFRPFYYPALLGEAVVWGNNVHLWYACRLVLLAMFIAGIWIAVARYLGIIVGLALVVVVLRAPFWGDVWARLGDGEIYAAAGLGIWILGLEGMFTSPSEQLRNLGLFAITCSTIMMVGSKETLFPFAGYTLCALVVFIYLHRESIAARFHLAIVLAYSGITAFVIGLALSRSGKDFLGQSVGLTERLGQILEPFGGSTVKFLLPALLLLGVTAGLVRLATPDIKAFRKLWIKPAAIYLAGVVLLWSLYLSQYIAYNGQWPTGYRYDFPGVLALPALVVISVVFVTTVLQQYPRSNTAVRGSSVVAALAVIILALLRLPFPLSTAVTANIDKTLKFQTTLSELATLARDTPQQPIILRANGAWTYEKIVSVSVYLHLYYDVPNKIAVKFYPDIEPKYPGLAEAIKQWEQDGRPQQLVPLASIADVAKSGCLSIGLDGPAEAGCRGGSEM
jgi:hypothetical protein